MNELALHPLGGGTVERLPVSPEVRVQFSRDGEWLVTSSANGHQTWHLPGLKPGPQLPADPDGGRIRVASFSPDGAWLATQRAGSIIDLWRTGSFERVITLTPPLILESPGLAWSPDGQRLVLRTRGPRIFEWDLQALQRELVARGLGW